jgi:hypothetical protein
LPHGMKHDKPITLLIILHANAVDVHQSSF